jgi:hypothetical protein
LQCFGVGLSYDAEVGNRRMGKRRHFLSALCIGCTLLSSASWATTVEPGQGELSINRGQGFKPVNSQVNAKIGDSVMVAPGGSATVVYDDGCKVSVQPGAVTSIAPLSPCASGSNAQTRWDWCRPDPTHPENNDCGLTPQTIAFWALFGIDIGFIISQILHHGAGPSPSSP